MNQVISVAGRYPFDGASPDQNVIVFDQAHQGRRALADLAKGLSSWNVWGSLGWDDIRQKYARSVLGPFWLTLSMGVMVLSLGLIYGSLFEMPTPDYLP